jgi:hypothetical protein
MMIGERETLDALIPAVNGVHGECIVCLEEFIETANVGLSEKGSEFRYRLKEDYKPFKDQYRVEVISA